MAGISLILADGGIQGKRFELEKSLDALNYLQDFKSNICLANESVFIGWNKYEEYPIHIISNEKYLILLEGKIYNKTLEVFEKETDNLIEAFESENYLYPADWIKAADGDFIIYIYNKLDRELFILNDIFGRLPLYYSISDSGICISRHLKFITDFLKSFEYDVTAFAEFLLMGFVLGERTLINSIKQVQPATLVSVKGGTLKKIKLHNFNFDIKSNQNKNFSENIRSISELFSESARNRLKGSEKNILSLSGGLDSRAVAACLYHNKIEFTSVGMNYSTGFENVDLSIAKKLSDMFNVKWEALDVMKPKGRDLRELLSIKEGMNSLSTATMLGFYNSIKEKFGSNINYITGDNGDKLIFTLNQPLKKLESVDEFNIIFYSGPRDASFT